VTVVVDLVVLMIGGAGIVVVLVTVSFATPLLLRYVV
jgi:hypothetical protein